MSEFHLNQHQQAELLSLARQSIEYGVSQGVPLSIPDSDDSLLKENGACFVTLTIGGELRGCIGSLEARRPLIADVCENAFAAALRDPRFVPVSQQELAQLHIEISVLGPLQEMQFRDEEDLLEQIVPFEDGLVLQEGGRSGTFLPLVWDKLPDKQSFFSQLKLKAGLPPHYWSDTLRCFRYKTFVFEE